MYSIYINSMNSTLNTVTNFNQRESREEKYTDLFKRLFKVYNEGAHIGGVANEVYNSKKQMVKPHFDYEENLTHFNKGYEDQIYGKLLAKLNEMFGVTDDDWAISTDSRFFVQGTGKKQEKIYKISYHFVLWKYKCNSVRFGEYIKRNMNEFTDNGLNGIDAQIYRKGINKFRIPMTKKKSTDVNSLLIPWNNKCIDTFHRHLLSVIDECEPLDAKFELDPMHNDILQQKAQKLYETHSDKQMENISKILAGYTIISQKSVDQYTLYNVKEYECGHEHKNNHNFLIHNHENNTLKIKCHDENCKEFVKILFKECAPTLEFRFNYIQNIPINEKYNHNYFEVKKYFEHYFVFIRGLSSFYMVHWEKDTNYGYYEKTLKPVLISGFSKDMYYKVQTVTKEGQVEISKHNFIKRYETDDNKNAFIGLSFRPYGALDYEYPNNDYNLFNGFNYKKLEMHHSFEEGNAQGKQRMEFLLNHIKEHICGNANAETEAEKELAKNQYNYLMSYLANIVQNPSKVPQIIMGFYSGKHGTGKSGFTKFISNVIGNDLSYFGSFNQIVEKHTNAHVGKLINIIEEADRVTTRKNNNVMKDLSQRERAIHNEKNKPQYSIKTFVRYFLTTNHSDGIYFDEEDRRYVIYTFDKVNDNDYVKYLLECLNDLEVIYLFGKYLENYEITFRTQHDWEINRPLTKDYYMMREANPIEQFLKDFVKLESVSVEHIGGIEYMQINKQYKQYGDEYIAIHKTLFYKLYCEFYEENNCTYRKYKNKATFISVLKTKFKAEMRVRKILELSCKEYYEINLKKLWERFYPDEQFINTHFG